MVNVKDYEELQKQMKILQKKLERSEHSRALIEQAKDHYDLVYRSTIKKLDEQKTLLDQQNKVLDGFRNELLIKNTELIHAQMAADLANEAKGRFLANMSHEIRTPLNGILGFLELLGETPLNLEQSQYVSEISGAAEVLLYLINDILDFSKIEASQMKLENIPFHLRELVQQSVSLHRQRANKKGLSIKLNLDGSIQDQLLGDPVRLLQILNNLLSNAIKFTEKGHIRVLVLVEDSSDTLQQISFMIEDTGIGMHEEELSNIFTPFTQADSSIARRFGGTGLGLAITKELVRLMDGTIEVTSTYQMGSCFRIVIPFHIVNSSAEPMHMGNKSDRTPASEDLSSLRVLLVDDNDTNIHLTQMMLERYGIVCDIAMNGKQAFDCCEQKQYDVILMDCQMPIMDGYEATRWIRTKGSLNTNSHIIAMTANALSGDQEKCLHAGMDEFLTKPFRSNDLLQKLNKHIQKQEDMVLTPHQTSTNLEQIAADLSEDLMIDPDRITKLLRNCIQNLNTLSSDLMEAIHQKRYEDSRKILHAMGGSAGNMHLTSVYEAIREIHDLLARNQLQPVDDKLASLLVLISTLTKDPFLHQ